MDCERLTPYLRRRCLALKVSDRVALVMIMTESLTPSLRTEDQAEGKTTEEKPAQESAAPSDGSTAQPKSEKPATGKGKGKGKK